MKLLGLVVATVTVTLASTSACRNEPPRAASLPQPPASFPTATSKRAARQVVEPRFREVYRRSCDGSITAPLLSPSGRVLVLCSATFSAEAGEYLGTAPVGLLALVDDERGLADPHSGEGLTLESAIESPNARHSTGAEKPESASVSLDGTRSVSIERAGNSGKKAPSWALVERALPSLEEIHRWRLEHYEDADRAGFLASGDPWVVTSTECKTESCGKSCQRTKCGSRSLFRANDSTLVLLAPSVVRAEASRDGSRAIVVYANHERAVVTLPEVSTLVELAAEREDFSAPFAIDARGEHIAYIDGTLRVARVSERSLVPIATDPVPVPRELAFSDRGRDLLVGESGLVRVLRKGASPKALPKPRVFTPPPGYRRSVVRGGEQSLGKFEEESEIVWPNQIARWRAEEAGYDVYVFAEDPRELARAKNRDAWGRLAVSRFEGFGAPSEHFTTWGKPGARSLEYLIEVRDGCDPQDRYVRMSERDGILYRIVVSAPPGTPPRNVAPVLERIFDSALGAPDVPRKLAHTSEPSREPC